MAAIDFRGAVRAFLLRRKRLSRSAGKIAALIVLSYALGGCGSWNVPPEANTWKNPVPANSATLAAARQLYINNCQKCHGIKGDGKLPPDSTYFYSTKPTDFTNHQTVDAMSDGEIFWKITHGRKPMPSFKNRLSDQQRWELVNLIREFSRR